MSEHEHEREREVGAESPLPPPPGLSLETLEITESGDLVLSFPLAEQRDLPAELTSAEREIAECLLTGLTNLEIAQRRRVSQFTVANQVAAIFAKLSVHSRLGLALLLRRAA